VSALDVSVQAQVINLLQDIIREFRLAFVLISHDLAVVRHVADRVAVMYLGQIVEEGPAERVFDDPRHPYTRALLLSVPGEGGGAPLEGDVPSPIAPPAACRFHTRCPLAQPVCRTLEPPLEAASDGGAHRSACHFRDSLPPTTRHERADDAANHRLRRLQSLFRRPVTPAGVPA